MDWLVTGALTIVVNIILYAVLSSRLHRQYNSRTFLQAAQKEMELLMTEMNQSAERNVAVFEDRVQKLRLLMDELDHKLVMVRKDQELQDRSRESYSRVRERIMESRRDSSLAGNPSAGQGGFAGGQGGFAPADLPPGPGLAVPAPVQPAASARLESRDTQDGAPEPEKVPAEVQNPVHPAARSHSRAQSREELKRRVVGLYRSGMDPSLIASQTGMSRGEVDLIISLGEGSTP